VSPEALVLMSTVRATILAQSSFLVGFTSCPVDNGAALLGTLADAEEAVAVTVPMPVCFRLRRASMAIDRRRSKQPPTPPVTPSAIVAGSTELDEPSLRSADLSEAGSGISGCAGSGGESGGGELDGMTSGVWMTGSLTARTVRPTSAAIESIALGVSRAVRSLADALVGVVMSASTRMDADAITSRIFRGSTPTRAAS